MAHSRDSEVWETSCDYVLVHFITFIVLGACPLFQGNTRDLVDSQQKLKIGFFNILYNYIYAFISRFGNGSR